MPNSIIIMLQERHRRIRAASRGARISLVNDNNGFQAILGCATTVRELAGPVGVLSDLADMDLDTMDEAPVLFIPYNEMTPTLRKLEGKASVALLDRAQHRANTIVFECFHVIPMGAVKTQAVTDDGLDDLEDEVSTLCEGCGFSWCECSSLDDL